MPERGKNERVFDQRVVHRYLGTGRVTKQEYEEHLASLPDCSENIKPREEGGDDDGYDRPIAAANEPGRRPLGLLPIVNRARLDDDDDDDDDDLDDDDDDLDDDDDDDEADEADDAGSSAAAAEAPADAPAPEAAPADAPADVPAADEREPE